jgi:hypothetical protein
MTDPAAAYRARISETDAALVDSDRRHGLLANIRLATAAAALVIGWLAYGGSVSWWWLAVPAAVFIGLAVAHDRVLGAAGRLRRVREFYARGLARMDGTWLTWPGGFATRLADGGEAGDDTAHDRAGNSTAHDRAGDGTAHDRAGNGTAHDLDLVGRGSLLELMDTTRTDAGRAALTAWLTTPPADVRAHAAETRARQAAVAELRDDAAFREALAVSAVDVQASRTSTLLTWAEQGAAFGAGTLAAFATLAMGGVALALGVAVGPLPAVLIVAGFLVQFAVTFVWGLRTAATIAGIEKAADDLTLLRALLARIEAETFTSPRLQRVRDTLPAGGRAASAAIGTLERRVQWLDSCRNQIFFPVAVFFQVPALLVIAIDRWRAAHGPAIAGWVTAVGEIEALSAIGTYAFEHPADPFPEIDESAAVFAAEGLGHPLLHESVAVRNDVRIGVGGHAPQMLIVSGSNMSGKSTLLRSVGLNVVLAMAGAPVRASRLRVSVLTVGATLRVDDSLQSGHSRFYAEILRIRSIIDRARGPVPLVFLLDEILAGTNSFDRRIGAEGVVRTLLSLGAIGFITTHDLALTELASRLGAAAMTNVHFEDRLENGVMVFDYRMRPGVVEHSNALALMRAVGIDVEGDGADRR